MKCYCDYTDQQCCTKDKDSIMGFFKLKDYFNSKLFTDYVATRSFSSYDSTFFIAEVAGLP